MDTTASPDGVPATAPDPDFPPVPADTKDWTWVMERPCPECGFVAAEVTPDRLPPWRQHMEASRSRLKDE